MMSSKKPKTILFYVPFINRSRDTESVMIALKTKCHNVIFLNQQSAPLVNQHLQTQGVQVFFYNGGSKNRWIRHMQNIVHLIFFVWKHRVDVVYSHLEPANFIAVFAQFFIRAKVYVFRHHSDLYFLAGKDKDISYRAIYKLAKKVIVVSSIAKEHMVKHEGVRHDKIKVIPLAYDFSLYSIPNIDTVQETKSKIDTDICLITVGHLTTFKRPLFSLKILNELIKRNYSAKLIFLGSGDMLEDIDKESFSLGIKDHVIKPGFVNNVLDYLASSTFLLHPSASESSCVAVKEAGLVGLPVIVADGVGDFNDYIVNHVNGFRVDSENFVQEAVTIIENYWTQTDKLNQIGDALCKDVYRLFDIKNVIHEYCAINE
jgi:glycosyltransferase involved in cell wall biosynthesis